MILARILLSFSASCQYGTTSILVMKTQEDDAHNSWLRHRCFAYVTYNSEFSQCSLVPAFNVQKMS